MTTDFRGDLKTLYVKLTPTQVSADTWPPPPTRNVINLAMIKSKTVRRGQIPDKFVRQTITGKIDDILREKYPIQLKDIFSETEGKRKVASITRGSSWVWQKHPLGLYISIVGGRQSVSGI